MRFGGFSEFSHSSIESTNEIQRMQEINQNLLRSLETITVGAKEVEIAELNSAQIRELRRLSAEASCLSQEICDLMLESMSLRLYSGLSEEELSKVKMEEAPKIIIAPDKGTLEEARNEVTRLNACKNGLQTEISEINRLIEAKAVISQKANLRLHNQDVIEQACKRNNEAIQRQLHPSGYSAKESAQFFIEQAHQQEIEQIAKERIEQEKRIEHGIHFQKVLFNETYGRKPKSAQESAEVFIEEQRRIEEEIQRRAKEKETIRLRRLKNDIMINDQLHPSGYSAKESAQFFIEQAHQQEIEQIAKERLAREQTIKSARKKNNEAIQRQLHPSGYSAKESAEFFMDEFAKEIANETSNSLQKDLIPDIANKNIFSKAIDLIKGHKLITGITLALGSVAAVGFALLKKKNNVNQPAMISNSSAIKPIGVDLFKKQVSKS